MEENLRESFRLLANGRARADVLEISGLSVVSLGVAFQMFNAAFFSALVETQADLEARLQIARRHFVTRNMSWSLWICEDWLAPGVRKKLSRTCEIFGLRLSSELPGMVAERIDPPARPLPRMDFRRVDSLRTLEDFRAIGSSCFHVPVGWFAEVFDERLDVRRGFVCWVGYRDGVPVSTAASVASDGAIGLYNVATVPEHRGGGYGEAITRYAIDAADTGADRIVLQSTSQGLRIYERMGFRAVTRILVYNSTR